MGSLPPKNPMQGVKRKRGQSMHEQRASQLAVDISIGAANGVAAVSLMQQAVLTLRPMRPLCLALKALLRAAGEGLHRARHASTLGLWRSSVHQPQGWSMRRSQTVLNTAVSSSLSFSLPVPVNSGMNEVYTGGLSSYAVFNLVLAHLQCEGLAPAAAAVLQRTMLPSPDEGEGKGEGAEAAAEGEAASLRAAFLRTLDEAGQVDWQEAGGGRDLGDLLAALLARCGTASCLGRPPLYRTGGRRGGLSKRPLALRRGGGKLLCAPARRSCVPAGTAVCWTAGATP